MESISNSKTLIITTIINTRLLIIINLSGEGSGVDIMIQNVFMYLDSILCNLILLGAKVKQKTLLGAKVRNISYSELRLGGTYPIG